MSRRWSPEDRQRFADGDRLRASTVPSMRFDGPTADEWVEEAAPIRHAVAHIETHEVQLRVRDEEDSG